MPAGTICSERIASDDRGPVAASAGPRCRRPGDQPSLNYAPELSRDWRPASNFQLPLEAGVEAVRSRAGIGILHAFIARRYQELAEVLPEAHHRRFLLAVLS